jgi:hypothetical protein
MANVVIGKVEVVAEDVLSWINKIAKGITIKGPAAILALTNLITAIDKVAVDVSTDTANPLTLLNIAIDEQQFADIKAVLPDIKILFTDLGIKFPS